MRYFVITYFQKANGEQDEVTSVTRSLKTRDIQCANVILDFRKCEVVKATMGGLNVPKNFDNIVRYYRQHYKNIIDRLFNENGFEVTEVEPETQQTEQKEKANVDPN
jgi:predicted nuclease with RNAse H fold